MNALPVLIVVWAVLTGLFLALLAYNGTITRYEEDQLFLDEANSAEKEQQAAIIKRVQRLVPYIRTTGALAALMTVAIIGLYTYDAWQRIQQ